MLRRSTIALALFMTICWPLALGSATAGNNWGSGHADVTWALASPPFAMDGTGSNAWLTTNHATGGQAIAFGMPLATANFKVPLAGMPFPFRALLVMDVPAATDPWWSTYPGGVPPGITTGGTIEYTVTGQATHHPQAIDVYGTYVITASTGQYALMVGNGQFSGSVTGGGGPYGQFVDFAVIGTY